MILWITHFENIVSGIAPSNLSTLPTITNEKFSYRRGVVDPKPECLQTFLYGRTRNQFDLLLGVNKKADGSSLRVEASLVALWQAQYARVEPPGHFEIGNAQAYQSRAVDFRALGKRRV